jgi:magnesium chelatase family protein
MVGGGSGDIRPGAVSLAHHGVLFLDEAPEFRAGVLDALRQPLESHEVVIARARMTARLPARFLLVLAANPCPCGLAAAVGSDCECSSAMRRRYLAKLSGPLLDRIDVHVTVDRPSPVDLLSTEVPEGSAAVAERVAEARARAGHRLAGTPWRVNAEVSGRELRRRFRLAPGALVDVETSLRRGSLSGRGVDRVLRVAWTIADLAGRDRPTRDDVNGALAYRKGLPLGVPA